MIRCFSSTKGKRPERPSGGGEKKAPMGPFSFGGEGGIRTLDTGLSPYNALAGRHLRPLGHLSALICRTQVLSSVCYPHHPWPHGGAKPVPILMRPRRIWHSVTSPHKSAVTSAAPWFEGYHIVQKTRLTWFVVRGSWFGRASTVRRVLADFPFHESHIRDGPSAEPCNVVRDTWLGKAQYRMPSTSGFPVSRNTCHARRSFRPIRPHCG